MKRNNPSSLLPKMSRTSLLRNIGIRSTESNDCFEKLDIPFSKTLNASDYQWNRNRTFIIGIRDDVQHNTFRFPRKRTQKIILKEAIGHLKNIQPTPTQKISTCEDNNEYLNESFSPHFMVNRVRGWNQQSFTLLAMARDISCSILKAPKMIKVKADVFRFKKGKEHLYRRLSVKECALIQTFPEDFIFHYDKIHDGYKMIGNAVPPKTRVPSCNTNKTLF